MDALNTFFVFNLTATIAVLAGFFLLRDELAGTVSRLKSQLFDFNVAGVGGAATSLVLLASVASLFR